MRRYTWHLDYFGGALGDLPKKLHGSDEAVLAVLRESPRFSIWDATTAKIAKTLDRLKAAGRIEYDNEGESYPWVRANVVAAPEEP